MSRLIHAETANEAWCLLADLFREDGTYTHQPSRAGDTFEKLRVGVDIEDPRQRWVPSRFPSMSPAFALAEVIWIINGRRDAGFLNYWNRQLPDFAGDVENYHGAYGYRLRQGLEFDQLERAYKALKGNSETRQVVLQIWDGEADFPDEGGDPKTPNIPCNVLAMIKIRGNKLEWTQIIRSNDVYRGVPYNFVQFTYLQELLAAWLDVEMGTYFQLSDSLHVYERDIPDIRVASHASPALNTDSISQSRSECMNVFGELSNRVDEFVQHAETKSEHLSLARWSSGPKWAENILCVLGAESARRNHLHEIIPVIMDGCDNPALIQIWKRWYTRWVESPKIGLQS